MLSTEVLFFITAYGFSFFFTANGRFSNTAIESSSSQQMALSEQDLKDCTHYLPLYKAILKGDLGGVTAVCDSDEHALKARITVNLDTALHVAVGTGMANHIVEYLLSKMTKDKIVLKNKEGNTVLSIAAIVNNVEAARMIMEKHLSVDLAEVANSSGWIPLIEAARHGQRNMIEFLLQFSESYLHYVSIKRLGQKSGVFFINLLIIAGFFDLALKLVQEYKNLATMELYGGESLLSAISRKPSAFRKERVRKLRRWQYVVVTNLPSYLKERRETNLMPDKALQLVKHLCQQITSNLDHRSSSSILKLPLLLAAELGVCEVVEEIIQSFPDAIWFTNEKNHNVFQLAVMNRRENVFNLIFQMSGHKHLLLVSQDVDGSNILHLAANSAPENQLNLIPGAALQMQRELQWYKEVEKIVQPDYREDKNSKGETPGMVFTRAHKGLVKEGEKWMKDAATSSSVAAALIATVVFTAAITVPGDYNDNGQPNFYKQTAFVIFSISDALSLFSSLAAIIMFLSILTARYAEDDFLYVLPKRLILGLGMLFLSVTAMMVAFGATVYLVFCDRNSHSILGLVGVSACLPVSLFAHSQYPLLRDLFWHTYGPGIFRKQSKQVLY